MDSGSPGPRQQRGQRPGHGLRRAPGPEGADGGLEAKRPRPGSPVGAFGSLQKGPGLLRVTKRELGKGSSATDCVWLQKVEMFV